ncbi:MAG: DUF192 domain-containing protein [Candidatus Liptonbacteria bacterium]|nr:DUF192 domain-containing protein [Candidatus Liptonbacteria bacterium]
MLKSTKVGYVFIAVFIVLLGVRLLPGNTAGTSSGSAVQANSPPSSATGAETPASTAPLVVIGKTIISVELATTTSAVQKGLSGRTSLGPQSGMLFIFSKPDIYHFWMPDMRFPIDIIWINNGTVVSISANATTTFNPASPLFYSPAKPAQYALEVNAGFSASHGIAPGMPVIFKNISP